MWLATALMRFTWHFFICHIFLHCNCCHGGWYFLSVWVPPPPPPPPALPLLPPDIFPRAHGCMVPGKQSHNSTVSAPSGTCSTHYPALSFSVTLLHPHTQTRYTSPLTPRRCSVSEPSVITNVYLTLTRDCMRHTPQIDTRDGWNETLHHYHTTFL